MTRTFKLCTIFFITEAWLILLRIVVGYIPMSDNASNWVFSFLVQVVGCGLIPILLYKFWAKGSIKQGFHFNFKINPLCYVLAVVVGFLLYYLTIGISAIYQNVLIFMGFQHVVTAPGTIYSGVEVFIMELVTVAVLPAIFEEIVNRGLLLSAFEDEKNDKKVVIIMALLFAFGHQNVPQTLYTFVGGLVMAYFALKTRSIIPGIIIHFINNGLSVVLDYSSQTNNALGGVQDALYDFINGNILVAIASWIAVAVVIVLILKYVKRLTTPKKQILQSEAEKGNNDAIYSLFGMDRNERYVPLERKRVYEYGMLVAAICMTCLTTVFTFLWGIWR